MVGRGASGIVERVTSRHQRYSLADAAASSGLPLDYVRRNHIGLALPQVADDEPVYDETHLENYQLAKALLDQGISEQDLIAVARTIGQWSRRMAEALVDRLAGVLVAGGDEERDIAQRYAEFAQRTLPVIDRLAGGTVRLHLLDIVRAEAIGGLERQDSTLGGARTVATAFVDLAGYTALSDRAEIAEIEAMAARFELLITDFALAPVRLVKLLGDGAMLICDEPSALVDAVAQIHDAAPSRDLPALHSGVSYGPAVRSAGDWYGQTVNVAARLCDVADAGEILVTAKLAGAVGGAARFEPLGARQLAGVERAVAVMRLAKTHGFSAQPGSSH